MIKSVVAVLPNGCEIIKYEYSRESLNPRFRVKRGKFFIGKTKDGGYSRYKSAFQYAMKNA